MTITIGKAHDNNIVIDYPDISRHHARLIIENECWVLEDLDSTNGTFVNGNQIVRKQVVKSDTIKLGNSYELPLREILKQNNDYSEEFITLKKIYDNYIEAKVRIQSSNQFKTRLLQSLPFALPGIIGVTIGFLGKGNHNLFVISLLIAVCAPTTGIYLAARQSAKIPRQLQDLSNEFKIKYVCPKCGTFLGEIPWESLYNKKQCPISSCRAQWKINE